MEFICLDIETTGLDSNTCEIIEVSAVKFNETEILDRYQTFVHYDQPIPEIVEHLTGINQSMTKDAPILEDVKQAILDFCQDLPIVGHNINFDINFLNVKGVPLNNTLFDTLPLSHILISNISSHSLEVLSNTFNQKWFPTHRAEDDCMANIELFWMFLEKIKSASQNTAYLWNKILAKNDNEFSQILQKLIPAGQPSPQAETKYYTNTETSATPEIKQIEFNIEQVLASSTSNTLFVVSDLTERNLTSKYTKIPDLNSEICLEKFQNYIENETLNYDETVLLLKVAKLVGEKTAVFKEDLNLFGKDYDYLTQLTKTSYQIPASDYPYLVNHFVFFRLLNENKIPYFENIIFEQLPFLEEVYIRANEKRITANQAEFGNPNLQFSLEFRNITNFGEKLKATENAEFYDSALLDNMSFNTPEFQDSLNFIQENTLNTELKNQIQDLKQSFSKYLIWIKTPDLGYNKATSDLAYIGYIPKDIDLKFDLDQILSNLNCTNLFTSKGKSLNTEIILQIPESLPDPNDFSHNNILHHYLLNELKQIQKQAIIISPAKAQISNLHKHLALPLNELGINLLTQDVNGSKGKILHNLENNEAPTVLICTQYFFLRNFPSLKNLEKLFITKIPMGLPNHIFYEYKKTKTSNSFMDLIVPNSAQTIFQILEQAVQENPDFKVAQLLDTRIINKSWGKNIADNLPNNIILNSCQ